MDKQEIEQAIRDYRWMMNEIVRERKQLMDYAGGNMVAQAGLESVMPKAQGGNSDPVAIEVILRDRTSKWVQKLENKVLFVQKCIPTVADEKERAVLECMLDGLSMVDISRHMGLSRTNIYKIRDSILEQFEHFEQYEQISTPEKQCV